MTFDVDVLVAQSPDGVEVTVRADGQPEHLVRAGYVVGADGMRSTVREAQRRVAADRADRIAALVAARNLLATGPGALPAGAAG